MVSWRVGLCASELEESAFHQAIRAEDGSDSPALGTVQPLGIRNPFSDRPDHLSVHEYLGRSRQNSRERCSELSDTGP